ncbi:uncharacterized protein LOC134288027 [Aedes albopictus]|uniref:Uncharacterized protein n=1 Tax=Aedes albopictus TaxID=7160 RepID=A0ABM1XK93_AEDAL
MNSQANVRQTRSQTRIQQGNANLMPGDDGKMSSHSSEGSFIQSIIDRDGACMSANACGVSKTTSSIISALSGTSSSRKALLDRELLRLEEEKQLIDDLNREKIERERALNEKELQQKLERGKEFIARKHELLRQQEEEEGKSVCSMRSSQRIAKRTEDWVNQSKVIDEAGEVVVDVRQVPQPTSAITAHPEGVGLAEVHVSSTPIKAAVSTLQHPLGDGKRELESEVKSFPPILESISIGDESEDSLEAIAVGPKADRQEQDKHSSRLPFVNLQPYANLLKVEEATVNSGAVSKVNRFGAHCYQRWSMETSELRKHNAHQLQGETEADMMVKEQPEIDGWRKREVELVNQIRSLQLQHATEQKLVREREDGLYIQLKQRDREKFQLEAQIEALEKILVEDRERMRTSEADLQAQLQRRDRELEALQHQVKELQNEIKTLRSREKQLQFENEAADQREQKAIRQRKKAEKDYWDFYEEIQQIIKRNEDQSVDTDCYSTLPPPPPSWIGDASASDAGNHMNYDLNRAFHRPLLPAMDSQLSSQAVSQAASYLGPSPQQLAARLVVIKELPIFSGDPVDWPLFISSYQHSTETCGYTNSENLLRLQRCLRGSAKDSVSSFLLHPSTVPHVLSTLQLLYGRPEQIVNNMIAKVRATPPPKADKLETLVSFGLVVQNLCGHLKAVGLHRYLTNPILLQELVDKLPTTVKFNWALHQEQVPDVDLNVFSEYMAKITSAASGITQLANIPQNCLKDERTRPKDRSFVHMHGSSEQIEPNYREDVEKAGIDGQVQKGRNNQSKCSICDVDSHQISSCTSFNALDLDGRWEAVKMHKLCARCLMSHARWPCKGQVCGINGCPKRHHRMLHYMPTATVDYQSDSYSSS